MELQSGLTLFRKQRWLAFLVLVVVLYFVAHITRAQEIPTEEPTSAAADVSSATPAPTDELLLQADGLTATPATPVLIDPTVLPADTSAAAILPTDVPTQEAVAVMDLSPTPESTDDLLPTLVPTDQAAISADIAVTATMTDRLLTLTFSAAGLADVYHVSLGCQVDPTVLQGVQAAAGDMLHPDFTTMTDTGFQPDGQWILLAQQLDAAPSLAAIGTLWTLSYHVAAPTTTAIVCLANIRDRDDQPLPLANPHLALTVDITQPAAGEASPTIPPIEIESTVSPEVTEVLPEAPALIAMTSTPDEQFHISGQIEANLPLRQVSLTIREAAVNQVVAVQTNGTFSADLPAGDYHFIFTALYCLPRVIPVTITDKPLRLPPVTLVGGDVDQNGVVDMADAILITQNFGAAGPLPDSSVDLNRDGAVNIYDLVLVSAGIH